MTNHEAVQVGTTLAGRYRVDRVIGHGGMGIVVKAEHLQLHQPVAIKLLLPEMASNPQLVARFLREAQAAARLKSEHVARVIDVSTLASGAPYLVLEYLDGVDLSSYPRAQLTIGTAVDLMLQACEALAEAHALGIVHRDIKPANLFLTRRADGTPLLKVLDFGISKAHTTDGQITAAHEVMGTPTYMSPEQLRSSRDVDQRTDLWSLGVVLYELLQGTPPFPGGTMATMLAIASAPVPELSVALPGELAAVVRRCLEKDPARRFSSTAELARAIAPFAHSPTQAAISVQRSLALAGIDPVRAAVEPAESTRPPPSTISSSAGALEAARTGRWHWTIPVALGALGGGVAIGFVLLAAAGRSGAHGPSDGALVAPRLPVVPSSSSGTANPAAEAPSRAASPVEVTFHPMTSAVSSGPTGGPTGTPRAPSAPSAPTASATTGTAERAQRSRPTAHTPAPHPGQSPTSPVPPAHAPARAPARHASPPPPASPDDDILSKRK